MAEIKIYEHTGDAAQELDIAKRHPCLNGEAHLKYGRIHLPVSPACNIGCKFCGRGVHSGNVPGAAGMILSPWAAADTLGKALKLCPEISVAGIAGPGDALATDHAIETFRLIKDRYPGILKCLSTNGLMLERRVAELKEVGLESLTVTINSLVPETLAQINTFTVLDGKILLGVSAAEALIEAQLRGLEAVHRKLSAVIKINTVLIPGLNDVEIASIAQEASRRGAKIMNIIPLIPQHGMADQTEPTCSEIDDARRAASPYLDVFRHCKRCRADAAGVMGKSIDISRELYGDVQPAGDVFSHG